MLLATPCGGRVSSGASNAKLFAMCSAFRLEFVSLPAALMPGLFVAASPEAGYSFFVESWVQPA
jgi:hypothetical protein